MYKKIVLDIETTGLTKNDELLQVSIIDDKYNVLFNEYIKPTKVTSWLGAEKKNHISPDMVKDKQDVSAYKDTIINILNNANLIIGFNLKDFDIPFLERVLEFKVRQPIYDVMLSFQKYFSLYPRLRPKLEEVCKFFGVVNKNAHDALSDIIATYDCYNKMVEESKKPKLSTIYKFPNGKMIYSEALAKSYSTKNKVKPQSMIYLVDGKLIKPEELGDVKQYRMGEFIKPRPDYEKTDKDPQIANWTWIKNKLIAVGYDTTLSGQPLLEFNDGSFQLEVGKDSNKLSIKVNKDGSIEYNHEIGKDKKQKHFPDARQWQKWAEDNGYISIP